MTSLRQMSTPSSHSIVPYPSVAGADYGFRPVGYMQLDQNVRNVVSDRLQAHEQLPGYLLVALALRNQGEDLLFALGELREGALRCGRAGGGKVAYDALGHPGPEDGFSARQRSDRVHYPLATRVLK